MENRYSRGDHVRFGGVGTCLALRAPVMNEPTRRAKLLAPPPSKGDLDVSNSLFGRRLAGARACALRLRCTSLALIALLCVIGCQDASAPNAPEKKAASQASKPAPENNKPLSPTEPPPPELLQPVALWKDGKRAGHVDAQGADAGKYVFMDLGEAWTPVLFTDGEGPDGTVYTHSYRPTYLALARGEFPDNIHGERASDDKYLELYGILPTLNVMRKRLKWAQELACSKQLDLSVLSSFKGVVAYKGPEESITTRQRYLVAKMWVDRFMKAQGVSEPAQLDEEALKPSEKGHFRYYLREHDNFEAIRAAQTRLECEGYFKGKGRWVKGAFDWPTHEALAEFERRHRVYSWGAIGPNTLEALRMDTRQVEHETVIRVLTERAVHAFGAVEDGSAKKADGTPIQYRGADGQMRSVPNLEDELRNAVIKAFGLTSPDATKAWIDSVGELPKDEHLYVAIAGPARPEYHNGDMELSVEIDRGDVWYEFLYDERGQERSQPVSRRPHTTLFVTYNEQRFPIASFGTTIGGWRSELIDENVWWKYKESPPGQVLWEEIVSAPVWLPPLSTPPRDLLKRRQKRKPDETKYEINYHEVGPSYASAYGLVAAYHRPFARKADGTIRITGDEGIRSHGSVDYMSIMRRHSHGCHRLHNHIAVRLFSFVINHRPHTRTGHQPTNWWMNFDYEEEPYSLQIKQGGYAFKLDRPLFVNVLEGRIRGNVQKPLAVAIPKYNTECGAYYMPDGSAVLPHADGRMDVAYAPPCATAPVAPGADTALTNSVADPSGTGAPSPAIQMPVWQ